MAVASLVLGIVSAAFCWFPWVGIPAGIIAVILGIIVMRDKTQTPQNRNMAIAGLILGVIGIVVSIITLILAMTAINALKGLLDEGGGLEKSLEDLGEGLKKGLEDLTKELPTTPPMF